jgi:hypothetical protein
MLDQQHHEELRALRNLEKAVRAYVLTRNILPEMQRSGMLARALKDVVHARKAGIAKSKGMPFKESEE